jgi:hypothetical protein
VVTEGVLTAAPAVGVVSAWPERLWLTAIVMAAITACLLLMRRGWVRRGRRQADIAPPPAAPALPAEQLPLDITGVEARFLGSNRAGEWLDRVVVHGLGTPSAAQVSVRGARGSAVSGVWVHRVGAPDVFVPAADVLGARHDRAAAARAYGAGGVLVVTWRLGTSRLEFGLRVRDPARAEQLRIAIDALASVTQAPGDRS